MLHWQFHTLGGAVVAPCAAQSIGGGSCSLLPVDTNAQRIEWSCVGRSAQARGECRHTLLTGFEGSCVVMHHHWCILQRVCAQQCECRLSVSSQAYSTALTHIKRKVLPMDYQLCE
jgi:hypothetical protein